MRNSALIEQGATPYLEVVSGAEKGKTFDLISDHLSIGRSENNDIVLPSESVSRHHAAIERDASGAFTIRDNQSKNGVQVNGQQISQGSLADGDVIQIGIFVFRFGSGNAMPQEAPGEIAFEQEVAPLLDGNANLTDYSKAPKQANRRPLIYGVLGVVLVYALYVSNSENKPSDAPVGDPAKADATTPDAVLPTYEGQTSDSKLAGMQDPALTRAEQETDKVDFGNSPAKEAEQAFKKGQREFLNKNYHRAIDAFKTALRLDRSHELADYYYRLAVYEVEAEAKKNMEIGRKYFETLQYQRAIYHFNEAIQLMQHRPGDKMAVDAEKYIAQSKRRLQAAEQFQ